MSSATSTIRNTGATYSGPEPGPSSKTRLPSVEATPLAPGDRTTTDLRRALIEAEHQAKIWKEQADEARDALVHSQSNARFLQTELDSTHKELLLSQSECRKQGELALQLKTEIVNVDKLSREQAELIGTIRTKYKNNSEILQEKLQSARQELIRTKEEHEQQAKLLRELRAETERKEQVAKEENAVLLSQYTSCKLNVEALETDLRSAQKELEQVRREHEERGQLVAHQQAEIVSVAAAAEASTKRSKARLSLISLAIPTTLDRNLQRSPELEREFASSPKSPVEAGGPSSPLECKLHRSPARASAHQSWNRSADFQQLLKTNESLKMRLEEVEGDANRYRELYRDEKSKLRRITDQYNAARQHTHVLYEELSAAQNELDVSREAEQLDVGLEDCPFEMINPPSSSGHGFSATKSDTLSVPDVVKIVEALNEEIHKVAVFLGQVLVYGANRSGTDRQEEAGRILMSERLATVLVEELTRRARRPQDAINPRLVQIVMQVAVTCWCYHAGLKWTSFDNTAQTDPQEEAQGQTQGTSSTWDYWKSDSEDHDWFIAEMYDRIRDQEDQAVVGRWRSITKSHIPFSTGGWWNSLTRTLVSIMKAAGWVALPDDGGRHLQQRLAPIFQLLVELRRAMGEVVTAVDLELVGINSGEPFDQISMQAACSDGRNESPDSGRSGQKKVGWNS
ncbi:hypothetical protein MD484_g2422, partial [Candolleomyces efflorescens]